MGWWDGYILRRRVRVDGDRNKVHFGEGVRTQNLRISIQGSGNKVLIGARTLIRGSISIRGDNHTVDIGEDSLLRGVAIICREGCGVRIGSDVLISTEVSIRTSDSHSIFDRSTGDRENPGKPVTIGDHVWVAQDVSIGKGVSIPNDCVIAARSFVTKSFEEEHILIGGMPARVLKTGVTWTKELKARLATPDIGQYNRA